MISLAAPARAGVEHVLYGQVLEYQCAVCVHKLPAQFMGKVFSSVGHALMDVSNDLAALRRYFGQKTTWLKQGALRNIW